jgi:hypothetical protein
MVIAIIFVLWGSFEPAFAATSLPFSDMQALAQSAAKSIASVNDADFVEDCCPAWAWKQERLVRLGYVQAKFGDREGLEQTVQQAKNDGGQRLLAPSQMASLGHSQATAQDRTRARQTLQEATEIARLDEYERVRDYALPTVVRAYVILEDIGAAIATASLIGDAFLKVIALSNAAREGSPIQDESARSRLIEAALQAAADLQNQRDQANGFLGIARAQVHHLDFSGGKASLQKARSTAQSIDNAGFQADTFIQLAGAYAEAHDVGEGKRVWNKALDLTQELDPQEQPYRLHYLAAASDKIRDWKRLSVTLEGLYLKKSLIEDPFHRASFITDLADLHFKIGEPTFALERLDEARGLAATIPSESLQRYVMMNVAKSYADKGESASAIRVANGIEQGALEHRYAYYYLALAQTRVGNIGGALASFHAIAKHSYLRAETAQAITVALSKAGDMDSAFAWANSLLSPYERALALLGIVKGQFEN